MKNFWLIGLSAILTLSCAKKKLPDQTSLLGLEYYPTTEGKFVIYEVDSTAYYDLQPPVNRKYRIKERIADSFTDNEGKPAIRLERFIKMHDPGKPYDSIPWQIKEVWMVNADKKSVQVSESNVRFTKLVFPVQKGASWNGNARNTLGERTYTYKYIDQKETIGGQALDKVLLVSQRNFSTAISYELSQEKYAKGVGLVFREIIDVHSGNVTAAPVMDRIQSGVVYKQTLVSYGID